MSDMMLTAKLTTLDNKHSWSAAIDVDRISDSELIVEELTFGHNAPPTDATNEHTLRTTFEYEGRSFVGDVILGPLANPHYAYLRGTETVLPILRRATCRRHQRSTRFFCAS
jgi:hypothetical protein